MTINVPGIGLFGIVTEPIDQSRYRALLGQLKANPVVFEALKSTTNRGDWTWSLCPCEIKLSRPTVVRAVHRILRTSLDRISVASTNYYPPDCSEAEFKQNFRAYLHTPNLPSFLRVARDEIIELNIDDPHKAVSLLFEAGLDESYLYELV